MVDHTHMKSAIAQAHLSTPVESAYCVGAVLVNPTTNTVLSTGFSRELPGNTHAEECCLLKLADTAQARGATMYTTMEPCGERLSGKQGCAQRLIAVGIGRVVVGASEPRNFIESC
ncbi:DRAP deaminase, partial [Irineochytrium annulatum]